MTGTNRSKTRCAFKGKAAPNCLVTNRNPSAKIHVEMLRMDHTRSSEHIPVEDFFEEAETAANPPLRCRACGAAVTAKNQRIAVNGRHDHVFFNPHGHVFEIGCFARAPGALSASPSSSDFSWFPGFAWQVAACAACRVHLGWHFQGERNSGFFGLILDRLSEDG